MAVEAEPQPIATTLSAILLGYAAAREQQTFGRASEMWQTFERLRNLLTERDEVASRGTLTVKASVGAGNWADVPWVALLDARVAPTMSDGIYCVFLFRKDMTGVYLTLNQGVTSPRAKLGWTEAKTQLTAKADAVRRDHPELLDFGFKTDQDIDLRSEGGLGSQYETSTIAYKLYERGTVPQDAQIASDLGQLLGTYSDIASVGSAPPPPTHSAWIFQANPDLYDIDRSLAELRRMSWLARQHVTRIKSGDRVFIWSSGNKGGIRAVGTIASNPALMRDVPEMDRYFRVREKFEGEQLRVVVQIEHVLEHPLERSDLLIHPLLRDLSILRAPQGSNFPVSAAQEEELMRLIDPHPTAQFDRVELFTELVRAIASSGFVFEPWQLASYVTALRTKPFVILAGVSGTGKSQLPELVARATGGSSETVAVRPDWTDSSEVLGYTDIEGRFRPGRVLSLAREAADVANVFSVVVLDEMNLARVEHYFAEVLSAIERRHVAAAGGYESAPLMPAAGEPWSDVRLPANLGLVGTVNMDETTQGFSRKVIDRAFTLELSDVDLANWGSQAVAIEARFWPPQAWFPRATRLGALGNLSDADRERITRVVESLTAANVFLADAQLQLGYRTRDEIALFVLHAAELGDFFVTKTGEIVEPLDLAIHMKVLPRLAGGSGAIKRCLNNLIQWADAADEIADLAVVRWVSEARPASLAGARLPRTSARLCLMRERLDNEGFTSYWI